MDVRDRTAVITGASRGIGAGLARAFQRRGMKLALCARSEPPGGVTLAPGRALFRQVDVRDAAAVDAFAAAAEAEIGPLDLWVNNAGLLAPIGITRTIDPEPFRTLLEVNVLGVLHGVRAFLRHLHAAGRTGCLVNIGSGASRTPYPGWGAYCASKAAVDQLTRVLAEEERDVRIFCLAPGVVETGMQELIRRQDPRDFPAVERFRRLAEDGALLDPEAPAEPVLKLAFGPGPVSGDPCVDARDLA